MTEVLTNPPAERVEAGTVVTDYGYDSVVLGHGSDGDVELCGTDGRITSHPATAVPSTRIDEPSRQAVALRAAVTALAAERRQLVTQHAETLDQIRLAAIEKHQDGGEICQDGLNRFLLDLGLPAYGPRVRVSYAVRGSYEADTTDLYEARTNAEAYLGIDLSTVDDADPESEAHKVEVTDVECIDL